MQLQLMRKEVLLLTCATSKVLTDAQKVLQGCLDPPESKAVEQAAQYLLSERLVQRQTQPTLGKRSGKTLALEPTLLGRLIDSMPLDIEASTLVMLGAFLGLLEEAVLLAVPVRPSPLPSCGAIAPRLCLRSMHAGLTSSAWPNSRPLQRASFGTCRLLVLSSSSPTSG